MTASERYEVKFLVGVKTLKLCPPRVESVVHRVGGLPLRTDYYAANDIVRLGPFADRGEAALAVIEWRAADRAAA